MAPRLIESRLSLPDLLKRVPDLELYMLLGEEETSEDGDVTSELIIPTTFRDFIPTSFCKARTVARCSGGYSSRRKRMQGWAARYVSR